MSNNAAVVKELSRQLKYYAEVRRREEAFDLSTAHLPRRSFPPLKSLPILPYDRQPEGFALLGHLAGPQVADSQMPRLKERERKVKVAIERNMHEYHFLNQPVASTKKRVPPEPRRRSPVRASPRKASSKEQAFRGGYPQLRTCPPPSLSRPEMGRMVNVAAKLLVYTEELGEKMKRDGRHKDSPRTQKGRTQGGQQRQSRREHRTRGSARPRPPRVQTQSESRGSSAARSTILLEDDNDSVPSGRHSRADTRARSYSPARSSRSSSRSSSARSSSASRSGSQSDTPRSEATTHDDTADNEAQTDASLLDLDLTLVSSGDVVDYTVVTHTGRGRGETCLARVCITLYGENGCSPPLVLDKSIRHRVPFQKGHTDEFHVRCHHVGTLKAILIGHDSGYSWRLEDVVVKSPSEQQQYDFACRRWLSSNEDSKPTVTLRVSASSALVGSGR